MSRPGFTLIEVLVAVTLSALIFVWIISFVTSWLENAESTKSRIASTPSDRYIGELLDRLAIRGWSRIDTGTLSPTGYSTWALFDQDGTLLFVGSKTIASSCPRETSTTREFLTITPLPRSGTETTATWGYSIGTGGLAVYTGASRVLGTGVAGNTRSTPLRTEFSGISSLLLSGSTLAVADPGNDRIVLWNTSGGTLSELDTGTLGIFEPRSLAASGSSLLIGASNGLFLLSDTPENGSTFSGSVAYSWLLSGFKITFPQALPGPFSPWDIILTCTWCTQSGAGDGISVAGNTLQYTLTGSAQSVTGDIRITVANLSSTPVSSGNHTATIELLNEWGTVGLSKMSPYFVRGDGNVWTPLGNRITRLTSERQIRSVVSGGSFSWGLVLLDTPVPELISPPLSSYPIKNLTFQNVSEGIVLSFEEIRGDCQEWRETIVQRRFPIRNP